MISLTHLFCVLVGANRAMFMELSSKSKINANDVMCKQLFGWFGPFCQVTTEANGD